MEKKYIKYRYTDSSIDSLKDFIELPNSLLKFYSTEGRGVNIGKKQEFLSITDENGKSNLDRIYEQYTQEEKRIYQTNYNLNNLDYIKVGTELLIPKAEVNNEVLSIVGINQFLEQKPFEGFWADKLLELQNDPLYNPVDTIRQGEEQFNISSPQCKVWIWSRALQKVLNVTPFVQSLSTSVDKFGTFNLELSSILDLSDVEYVDDEVFFNFPINGKDQESIPFFVKYFQQNDVVFIRFEELLMEQQNRIANLNEFVIPESEVPNQVYDMIGLIDNIRESTLFSSVDSSVYINGRDCMKLLIDDESYFFPQLVIKGEDEMIITGEKEQDKWIKRSFVDQKYHTLFDNLFRSIFDTLGFIINQLSNLGVLTEKDNLLNYYKDKTQVYRISDADKRYLDNVEIQGLWQIINLFVDSTLNDRRVCDSSLTQPDGSLISQFEKVCQDPFVEFYGDTYGDRYNLIVRQPPFTQSAILSFIENNSVIDIEDYESKDLTWEENYFAWYQLTPRANLIGGEINLAPDLIPIVHFTRYAEIFGNKSLRVSHNYVSNSAMFGKHSPSNRNLVREAIVNDLSYLVESNMYLPFTRKGSITLPYGDRRVKKGTFVRFKPTGEIFYVNSVSNNLTNNNRSIDRYTTLTVSRGMVEKYIKGSFVQLPVEVNFKGDTVGDINSGFTLPDINVESGQKFFSYFNICNTKLIKKILMESVSSSNDEKKTRHIFKTNFEINEDILNFFLQRKQFE